jgi:hypothetical protein
MTMEPDHHDLGIVRAFCARATREGAETYAKFFQDNLVPSLPAFPGIAARSS